MMELEKQLHSFKLMIINVIGLEKRIAFILNPLILM